MINRKPEKSDLSLCDFDHLNEITGGKKDLIKEIIDLFIQQIPEELQSLNDAVSKTNYTEIKSITHNMKSSVSVMNIFVLKPILQEMCELGNALHDIQKIKELNLQLNLICIQAITELKKKKINLV